MIRNRIKQRIQERRDKRTTATDKSQSSEKANEVENEEDFNMVDELAASPALDGNSVLEGGDPTNTSDRDEDEFDYLTDICKDKKFNQKELSIIIRVLRLELQPLIYLALFGKGVIVWENTALSLLTMLLLLYMAYIDVVKYLFGAWFMAMCALMYSMKLNPHRTIFVFSLFVGLVTPMEEDEDISTPSTSTSSVSVQSTEKELRKWQIIARAKKVRQKIQAKIVQLGGFQYALYQLSIYIGKLRAVLFYKHEPTSKILCCVYGVIGLSNLSCMVFPARINFAISVLALFAMKPLLAVLRKGQTAKEREEIRKKLVAQIESIEPDIPMVAFANNNQDQ